jgi:hypothetical protein
MPYTPFAVRSPADIEDALDKERLNALALLAAPAR